MRKVATAIAFFCLLTLTRGHGFSASIAASNLPLKISISLPQEVLVTDDLDARDEFNRPIRSVSARREFSSFWTKSLNAKILDSLTPLKLRFISLLAASWDVFAGRLQNAKQKAEQVLEIALIGASKIVHKTFFPSKSIKAADINVKSVRTENSPLRLYISLVISSTRLLR